jgi:geranylgeranyl pyrophosphate synthase
MVRHALALLRSHPSLQLARDAARLEARRARHALRIFPRTASTATVLDGLAELADYAVSRVT